MKLTRPEHVNWIALRLVLNREVAKHGRDSKDPVGPAPTFALDQWTACTAGVRAGEFDRPSAPAQRPVNPYRGKPFLAELLDRISQALVEHPTVLPVRVRF